MLTYPDINPVAFSIGPLRIHWYGIMYLIGFFLAWTLALYRVKKQQLDYSKEQVGDLIFYAACGVVIGGRLGYMLFYGFHAVLDNPLSIFKIWEGGMSFHGGLLGVMTALWFFARRTKKTFLDVTDFVAPLVPLGLGVGRLGNFINGELWGRVTDLPWGMVFPYAGVLPRHPSQLYEFFLEGIVLFVIVWWTAAQKPVQGRVSAVFLIGYALIRMLIECFRQPDWQLGYVAFGWLTMGQLLSIPMLLLGVWLWGMKQCKPI